VGGSGELLYVARSVLVGVAEGRTAWLWNNLNQGPWLGEGAILERSDIYSFSAPGCGLGNELNAANVTWSRVRNNRFFGGGGAIFTQGYLDAQANAGGGAPANHDWSLGNTFAPLATLPPWGGPGDPTQVPLPSGLTLITGEGNCPSGP
jgi:hypothetical protein